MEFLVMVKVLDTIAGKEADRQLRETLGQQFQRLMESRRVKASGLLAGMRGAFFVLDINAPEELYTLLGPEMYGNCHIEAHPVVPIATAGELFQQWAREGR